MFKTVKELEDKIEEYFATGAYKRKVVTENGQVIEVPTPMITDLALFLGFCNRQSFYDYENNEEFSDALKKARARIEREYEANLRNSSCAGSIFALKNFGWVDKTDEPKEGNKYITNIVLISPSDKDADSRVKALTIG